MTSQKSVSGHQGRRQSVGPPDLDLDPVPGGLVTELLDVTRRRPPPHAAALGASSLLVAAGTTPRSCRRHLGQASYAITATIDSHVAPAQARETADRMDEALSVAVRGGVAVRVAGDAAEAVPHSPGTPPLTCANGCRADRI